MLYSRKVCRRMLLLENMHKLKYFGIKGHNVSKLLLNAFRRKCIWIERGNDKANKAKWKQLVNLGKGLFRRSLYYSFNLIISLKL